VRVGGVRPLMGAGEEQWMVEAVERLAEWQGITPRPDLLLRALRRRPTAEAPFVRLCRVAEAAGLRVVQPSPGATLESKLQSGFPMVQPRDGGGWRVIRFVRDVGRGKVEVVDFPGDARVRVARLADVQPAEGESPFWPVDPAAPGGAMLIPRTGEGPTRPADRIWRLLQVERDDILVVLIYGLCMGILALATPLTVQILINTVAFGALQQPIILLAGLLLVSLGMAAGLGSLQRMVVETIQQRIFTQLVADLAWRLPRVKRAVFDSKYGPELVNRFFDVLTVQKASSALLLQGVDSALQALVGMLLLGFYHPMLLAFDIFLLVSVAFVWGVLGRGAQRTAIAESYAKFAVAGWLEEVARHPSLFKLQVGPQLAIERADSLARDYLTARRAHFRVYLRQFIGTLLLQGIAGAGLLGVGGSLVVSGELSLGQLVAAEFVVATVLNAFVKFAEKLETWYDLVASVDKLGHLVELPTERVDGVDIPVDGPGLSVRLDGVRFGWSQPVLDGVDLGIDAGAHVVLEGPAGAGKSTLVDLLLGFREAEAGRILLGGEDLRDLRLADIREQALLLRGIEVVGVTIADNVAWEEHRPDRGVVREALEEVGLLDELMRLPKGLDTVLTPDGAPLSDGQLRRLIVARAIVARPRLLIVDHLLDGLAHGEARELLRWLTDPRFGWTLLVLTRDATGLNLPGVRRVRLAGGQTVSTMDDRSRPSLSAVRPSPGDAPRHG